MVMNTSGNVGLDLQNEIRHCGRHGTVCYLDGAYPVRRSRSNTFLESPLHLSLSQMGSQCTLKRPHDILPSTSIPIVPLLAQEEPECQ